MPVRPLYLNALMLILCVLAASVGHCAEPQAVVTLHAEARATGADVMLREVADLQADPEMLGRLALVSLSSSPLAGTSRIIEAGYISLRLRRAGFGPLQVAIVGERVTVRRPAVASGVTEAQAGSTPHPAAAVPPLVKRGQLVEVVAECGAVTVRASAIASRDAAEGELVELRLPDSSRRSVGRVVGPGRVSLILREQAL